MIAARSALLDYYSDKAAAFGGFFLASIFGLISMLVIVQGINCNNHPFDGILIGTILIIFCAFGYLVRYLLSKPDDLQNMKYFVSYFFATMFCFLSFLLLIRGIQTSNFYFEDILIGLSFLPIFTFAYTGYYVLLRFNYYAQIAAIIEQGDSTPEGGGLRFNARLDKVFYFEEEKPGKLTRKTLIDFIKKEFNLQDKLPGKKIIRDRVVLKIAYWLVIFLLLTLTYGTHFIS